MASYSQAREEHMELFNSCVPNKKDLPTINALVEKIVASKDRYEAVGNELGIPWYFIGVIHMMESNCNFKTHLHNGDPLTARTKHVPSGRPLTGNPPFTWEESAKDALICEGFAGPRVWDLPMILYRLEKYNGFGYRRKDIKIPSPYLWSMSNHYTAGKFKEVKGADGKWRGVYDPNLVSKQCGAAVLLKQMAIKKFFTA